MKNRYLSRRDFLSMTSTTAAALILAACGPQDENSEVPRDDEPQNENSEVPPGWEGGFVEPDSPLAYPDPDLTSLPMLDNMENIPNIQRQQKVIWPEFSWESIPGDPNSRCFQRFAHDISRVGYDNTGRVWSIICPQQGTCIHNVDCLNLEITVIKQRGWVNEETKEIAVDMTVEGAIWFSPSSHQNELVRYLWDKFEEESLPFPSTKATAIKVETHKVGNPNDPIFLGRKGETTAFQAPDFARHREEAWTVGNLSVEIGSIKTTEHPAVNRFNEEILALFNMAYGNILQAGNVLTWNLWFTAPELVDTEEWQAHAEKWRESIDADHGAPTGPESEVRLADRSVFEPPKDRMKELKDIIVIVEELLLSS